ncbi:hypothetical protein HNP84_002821 [Thermocatellispora tengchongensis]|uniref:VOC domain-containing protein n=1 Tax=Thermocatellispora tengchongensis TaxID=1073253 RepID=A0A840P6L2_9ACTN|nr:VOC family protein [Thermocatellispora tengchongensis]MBB5133100.1 hypothetical protein [Thermocatellispora tengchongensis]
MSEVTAYQDGAPCWAELSTDDVAAAVRFYSGLLGWSCEDQGEEFGHYTMCSVGGRPVAAISPQPPEEEPGPATWGLYLSASDVEATVAKVEPNGGKILAPPGDVPGFGRFAIVCDPQGAVFGLWQEGPFAGAGRYAEPGAMAWHELNTTDAYGADAFYRALFGYEQEQIGDGAGFDYTVWSLGGRQVAGRMLMSEEWQEQGDIPPHWMTYFAVADCDLAAERARELGGEVHHEPFDSPYGRLAVLSDPSDAIFTIIRPAG